MARSVLHLRVRVKPIPRQSAILNILNMGRFIGIAIEIGIGIGIGIARIDGVVDSDSDFDSDFGALHDVAADKMRIVAPGSPCRLCRPCRSCPPCRCNRLDRGAREAHAGWAGRGWAQGPARGGAEAPGRLPPEGGTPARGFTGTNLPVGVPALAGSMRGPSGPGRKTDDRLSRPLLHAPPARPRWLADYRPVAPVAPCAPCAALLALALPGG